MNYSIIVKTNVYRLLWLKTVFGFDPDKCCAKSLKGSFVKGIIYGRQPAGTVYEGTLQLAGRFGYLCGVTAKYDTNLHIAFEECPGSKLDVETDDIIFRVSDARRLPIPSENVDAPTAKQAACRNYRFGATAFAAHRSADSISSERP